MQKRETKMDTQERISFGALMLTIVITNVATLVYVAPYA
jgi:hypothetical protein